MGNKNSYVCCMSPDELLLGDEEVNSLREPERKQKPWVIRGESETAASSRTTAVNRNTKHGLEFSSSSISSKSSTDGNITDGESIFEAVDVRNDEAQGVSSTSLELRAAQSSYDEATTEAVNSYYGDPRQVHYRTPNQDTRDGSDQQRDQ